MKAAAYYETGAPEVFRYEEVPDPVCHTYSGKLSSSCPEIASSAARMIASARHLSRRPAAAFTSAAAFFT